MIKHRSVICADCGKHATVQEGGGTGFFLLHCESCGEPKTIEPDAFETAHLLYLKGLPERARQMCHDYDRERVESTPGEPLSLEQYFAAIEEAAGRCLCGGQFSLEAPPRCPRCKSADLEDDPDRPVIYG